MDLISLSVVFLACLCSISGYEVRYSHIDLISLSIVCEIVFVTSLDM